MRQQFRAEVVVCGFDMRGPHTDRIVSDSVRSPLAGRAYERSALNTVRSVKQNKQTNNKAGEQTELDSKVGEQTISPSRL